MSSFEPMQADPAPEMEAEAPAAEETSAPAPEEAPTAEAEQAQESAEPTPEPEQPGTEQPKMVPLAAKQDEVRKRQELELQNARLQAQLEIFQQQHVPQQQQPAEPQKSQEELDLEFLESPTQAVQRLLQAERQQMQQEFNTRMMTASEARAEKTHGDFSEMRKVFIEQTKAQPHLVNEMWAAPDPAEFAYQWAKQYSQFAEAGSMDALLKQAEERGRQAAVAELEKRYAVQAATSNPQTTAGARAAGQAPPAEYPSSLEFGNGY